MTEATILPGDCLAILPTLPDCSVDAVVTDPPYGLEFMGKEWDGANGFRRSLNAADAGRADVFGRSSRTSPEYRAGTTFQAWCELWAVECLRILKPGGHLLAFGGTRTSHRLVCAVEDAAFEIRDSIVWLYGSGFPKSLDISKAIDRSNGINAATWEGWGSALKPAHEPIVVARKPLQGTVAGNVLRHGTGALNIDAARVTGTEQWAGDDAASISANGYGPADSDGWRGNWTKRSGSHVAGRWPANVVLDEHAAAELDEQSGNRPGFSGGGATPGEVGNDVYGKGWKRTPEPTTYGDSGGASRFYYTAKSSSAERLIVGGVAHPTVKPLDLMRWLVRLVTPPGGTVLDPFAGSGTTIEAALREGFNAIGIERETDYLPLIHARIARTRGDVAGPVDDRVAGIPSLFDPLECWTCDDRGWIVPSGSDIRLPCPDCRRGEDY